MTEKAACFNERVACYPDPPKAERGLVEGGYLAACQNLAPPQIPRCACLLAGMARNDSHVIRFKRASAKR